MERFAKRHRKTLNELLGILVAKPPLDSTFRLLLAQLDVEGFEALLGSIDEAASGAARYGLRPTASTLQKSARDQQPGHGHVL